MWAREQISNRVDIRSLIRDGRDYALLNGKLSLSFPNMQRIVTFKPETTI